MYGSKLEEKAPLPVGTDPSTIEPGPRVAVLIPVFNGQDALKRSLASLSDSEEQLYVVVVDDGSEPPVEVPLDLPFAVRLIRLPKNCGITRALNVGLEHILSKGYAYVARLDAGDLSLPGRCAAQMAFLDAHPDHAVVGCWTEFIDPNGSTLFVFRPPANDRGLRQFQHYRVGFVHSSVMLRTRALRELGLYDERFGGAEDFELFLRLGRRYRLANLPKVYIKYEVNLHSLSARRFRQGITRLRVLAHHFEAGSVHAWLGFARNILLLFVTRGSVIEIKRRLAPWQAGRAEAILEDQNPAKTGTPKLAPRRPSSRNG